MGYLADIKILSQRENEVLRLMADGLSNGEMANELFISESTLRKHVASIFEKLGVKNRTEAAAYYWKKLIETRYMIIDWTDRHTEVLAEKYNQGMSVNTIARDMELPVYTIKEKLKTLGFVL